MPWVGRLATAWDCSSCLFFFQAEDGIRDTSVTGVQTCALPISFSAHPAGNGLRFLATCSARDRLGFLAPHSAGDRLGFLAAQSAGDDLALVIELVGDRKSVV